MQETPETPKSKVLEKLEELILEAEGKLPEIVTQDLKIFCDGISKGSISADRAAIVADIMASELVLYQGIYAGETEKYNLLKMATDILWEIAENSGKGASYMQ